MPLRTRVPPGACRQVDATHYVLDLGACGVADALLVSTACLFLTDAAALPQDGSCALRWGHNQGRSRARRLGQRLDTTASRASGARCASDAVR